MFTEIQLSHYFHRHDVGQDGQDYVLHVRHSQASRMVGAHARKNVCSWFYSEKMQHTISTESRTAERAFAVLCEFDDNVLEIWDQPEPVVIEKHTRGGYLKRSSYTPDFLVLRRDGPVLVEVKEKRAVEKLKCSVSKDWIERKDGEYDFLPPKRYFSDLGLGFEVFVASADQRFRVFNQELLLRARAVEATAV